MFLYGSSTYYNNHSIVYAIIYYQLSTNVPISIILKTILDFAE